MFCATTLDAKVVLSQRHCCKSCGAAPAEIMLQAVVGASVCVKQLLDWSIQRSNGSRLVNQWSTGSNRTNLQCTISEIVSLQATANGLQTRVVMMQLLFMTEFLASICHVAGAVCGCCREHVLL